MAPHLLLLYFVLTIPPSTTSIATLPIPEFTQPISLVDASVVQVAPAPQFGYTIVLETVVVYCGDVIEKGQTFTVPSYAVDTSGIAVWPPPSVGEEGLWVVRELHGKRNALGHEMLFQGMPWRFDPSKEVNHSLGAHAFGEEVAKVWRANHDEAIALLERDTESTISKLAAWAVHSLGVAAPSRVIELSHGLAHNDRILVAGQIAVDEVMCQIDRDKWIKSEDRAKLFQGWAAAKPSEGEQRLIVQRLDIVSQQAASDDRDLLNAMARIVKNPAFTAEWRRAMEESIFRKARRDGEKSLAAKIYDELPGVK